MTRLGTLAQFDLDHLDLVASALRSELVGRETSIVVAAAKIAAADFPNEISAEFAVVGADAALAGIVIKAALGSARVQRTKALALSDPSSSPRC